MIEQIVTGRKYRILTDAVSKIWDRISFWTSSVDVEMGDGHTLEQNLGAIKGLTTSKSVGTTGYAADATALRDVNNSLGGLRFGQKDGRYGYYTGAGADTFCPFNGGNRDRYLLAQNVYSNGVITAQQIQAVCDQHNININQLNINNFYTEVVGMHSGIVRCTEYRPQDVINAQRSQSFTYNENDHTFSYDTGAFSVQTGVDSGGIIWLQFSAWSYGASVSVPGVDNWATVWESESGTNFNRAYGFYVLVYPIYNVYLTY